MQYIIEPDVKDMQTKYHITSARGVMVVFILIIVVSSSFTFQNSSTFVDESTRKSIKNA